MRVLALAAVIALAGCTVDNSDNCGSVHSYASPQTDGNGLTLEPSQEMHATFEQISKYYDETMACVGLYADGPTVRYVSYDNYFNGAYGSPWAGYISSGLIFVNTDSLGPSFERDCRTDEEALKHEFIHHIMDANSDYHGHFGDNAPIFAKCGVGVNTYN